MCSTPLYAQQPEEPPQGLKMIDSTANTVVPATFQLLGTRPSQATANFVVTYSDNFPQEAIDAYEFAVGMWETHLNSNVQIDIEAEWIELSPNTHGAAGPAIIDRDFPGAPQPSTWYPDALVETITGMNSNPVIGGEPVTADITSQFNSNLDTDGDGETDWDFSTDTTSTPGTYNFATFVLHELGHALGFIGTFTVGEDACGGSDLGCWGIPANSSPLPLVYDRFTEDISGTSLLNTHVYPNPSEVLGDTLQSDNVVFDSPTVRLVNQGIAVNLYAPSNFEVGASYSHLDEDSFPPGNINSLMTPFLARQEIIYTPGPVACGMMKTIGWPLGPGCEEFMPDGSSTLPVAQLPERIQLLPIYPNPVRGRAIVPVSLPFAAHIQVSVYDVIGRKVTSVESSFYPAGEYKIALQVQSLPTGFYIVRAKINGVNTVRVMSQGIVVK